MQRFFILACGLPLGLAVLFAASAAAQEQKDPAKAQSQKITLHIEGVECANCARVMTTTLKNTEVKIVGAIRPETQGPSRVTAECPRECELGAVAAKVAQAQTPHREKVAPSLSLVLFIDPAASEASVEAACRKIEGLPADACRYDPETDELHIAVPRDKEIQLSQIMDAMQESNVKASTTSPEAKTPQRQN